jgi:hypothetical protein
MHYRNGREAKNGDRVVQIGSRPVYDEATKVTTYKPTIETIGVLFDAVPGNDHCNGSIAALNGGFVKGACLCDCLHVDDVDALLAEKGLDKRPAGK